MLNVNTLPNRKDEELMFDECYSQLRFRSKRTEEGRQKYFKTNALVPREEGATVAATPTFSSAGCLFIFQAGPAAFFHGVLQTIGKTPLTT